jgi:hypothetical protein
MVLWQFITFTVLIGAFVVYASVIARRLGCANARLSRIEEALLVTSRPVGFADSRAADPESTVSDNEGRAGYLTIRDLKVRSEQHRARSSHSSTRSSVVVPESRDALRATRGPKFSRGATPERGDLVAMSSGSHEALRTRSEQESPHGTRPLNVESVPASVDGPAAPVETSDETLNLLTAEVVRDNSEATSSESRAPVETSSELSSSLGVDPANGNSVAKIAESGEALDTTGGRQNPPSHCPPSEDLVAEKNRDALLYLSNQRRRRRAHPGY